MNKKSFFAKRSELQKVDVLVIYIEENPKKGIYKIKEIKVEELLENLEAVSTFIEQAIWTTKETKYADDQELKEMMSDINNTIASILDYIKDN